MRPVKLCDEDVITRTIEDDKVGAALEDLIKAMHTFGRDGRTGEHLLDVIEYRLQVYSEMEIEPEYPEYDDEEHA